MRSERIALAAALAATLLGCPRREIDVKPFALSIETLDGTPPLDVPPDAIGALATLSGVATREGDTALRVANAATPYTVRLAFSNEGSRDVAFPDQLDGADVILHVLVLPGTVAPDGTPLPFPAVRIATGTADAGRYQFLLADSPFPAPTNGVAGIPYPITRLNPPYVEFAFPPVEDFPYFEVVPDRVYFEPADCGLQYYDQLRVRRTPEAQDVSLLRSSESLELAVPEGDPEPWTVRHVLSWHRVGSCGDDARVWTQFAAWRK